MVEDNVVNQRVAVRFLENLGCQVETARHGREALECYQRTSYDCIFMDVQMPELDGFAATALIRQQEQGSGQHVPIIALTANAQTRERERCCQVGMDDYLSKPMTVEALHQMLRRYVTGAYETKEV